MSTAVARPTMQSASARALPQDSAQPLEPCPRFSQTPGKPLGPTIGGLMVDNYGWRSVFFLAVPFSIVGLAMGLYTMPDRAGEGPRRPFDTLGFGLLILALAALLTGLSSGQKEGWGAKRVELELGVALLAGIGFTMSLFIAGLSFGDELYDQARLGIFVGSLVSAGLGIALLGSGGKAKR